MKGSLAAMAHTAKAIVKSGVKLKGDLWVIAWVGHEAPHGRGEGPKAIAQAINRGEIKVDAAVITEGWIDCVMVAQGGMAIFTITVSGPKVSYHSTQAPLRKNPVLWTSELIQELHRYDEELNEKDWHPLIRERPHLQICIVKGGDFYNRVPTKVEVTGNVRWDPGQTVEDVRKELELRLSRLQRRLWHKYDMSVAFDLKLDLVREAAETSPEEEIVKKALKAAKKVTGREIGIFGSRGVGDASIINEVAKIPTISYGPFGYPITAHSDNEYQETKDLETVSKVYLALAIDYCGVKE